MKIASVGVALPDHEYSQEELTQVLVQGWKKKFFNVNRLLQFHKNLIVGSRRFCVSIEELAKLEGFGERNDIYITHAVDLGEKAILDALRPLNLAPQHIDHLFFTSVTGIAAPSIDARLINKLCMKSTIRRTPIFGLGCLGGAAGIARAADYVKAYPDQIAVLLSVELCSLTIQKEDLSIANIVGTGLFGDGAAAVVVAGENVDLEGPSVQGTHSSFYPDSERIMGWDVVDHGFKIVLSPNVPKMVRTYAQADLEHLLQQNNLQKESIQHYICHPGGPKVLEVFQETLGIPREKIERSWQTLQSIGNLSSTSVLLVLQETLQEGNPQKGDYGILMAMGPGFCSEWVLLHWK